MNLCPGPQQSVELHLVISAYHIRLKIEMKDKQTNTSREHERKSNKSVTEKVAIVTS